MKQLVFYGLGFFVIGFMMYFDPDLYQKASIYLYIFGLLLLVALILAPSSIAPVVKGQKSWFVLPGLSIQPSEFMKIFTIMMLASSISKHNERFRGPVLKSDFLLIGKIVGITALPLLLVMQQPDLGTSLVFIAIMVGMILISGVRWRVIIPLYTGIAALATTVIILALQAPQILEKYLGVKEYHFGRIYSWLQPLKYEDSSGYQLVKAMRAIGSGQLFGKGTGGREVYMPESQTDFIFSIIGEEYGFIGTCVVLLLFFLLIYRLTVIAQRANSHFSSYVLVGIIVMITFHVFQNIGMSIQLLPITGIPLPFVSYGGSSLLATLMAMGFAFAVTFHHRTYMFGEK